MGLLDSAVWLIGPAVDQPEEFRRLRRIRSRVYTKVAPLRAEIVRSPEPIAFEDLDRGAFTPLKPGTAWGKIFDCAWLRITGEVPAGTRDPVVLLGIRGEGLVVAPDGQILDGVSTVWQQGDLPHSGGRYRPVRGVDTSIRPHRAVRRRGPQRRAALGARQGRLSGRPRRHPRR